MPVPYDKKNLVYLVLVLLLFDMIISFTIVLM